MQFFGKQDLLSLGFSRSRAGPTPRRTPPGALPPRRPSLFPPEQLLASFPPGEVVLVLQSSRKEESRGGFPSGAWYRENPLPPLEIDIKRMGPRPRQTARPKPVGPVRLII